MVWLWLCVKCGSILLSSHDARHHEHAARVIRWKVDDAYLSD